jgi:hypothetical protein
VANKAYLITLGYRSVSIHERVTVTLAKTTNRSKEWWRE